MSNVDFPFLQRRTKFLEDSSTITTVREKIIELLHDEDKHYNILYRHVNTKVFPLEITDNETYKASVEAKRFLSKRYMQCAVHIVFLNNKVMSFKDSEVLPGLTITDMMLFLNNFKHWVSLFIQLQKILKEKMKLLDKNIENYRKTIGRGNS